MQKKMITSCSPSLNKLSETTQEALIEISEAAKIRIEKEPYPFSHKKIFTKKGFKNGKRN